MFFGLSHDELRRLVDVVVGTVPINDDAINSPTDHVCDLPMHLRRVSRTVAHIHMVRASEPKHQVRINLGRGPGIEQ